MQNHMYANRSGSNGASLQLSKQLSVSNQKGEPHQLST